MVTAMTNEEAIVQLEIDATNLVGRLASEPVHDTSFSELWKRKLEAIDIAIYAVKMFDKHEAECERCACNLLAERDVLKEEKLISNADVEPVRRRGKPVYKNRPEHYYTYSEVQLYDGDVLYKREHHIVEENPAAYCPECGERLCSRFTNYCPNCGTKMQGDSK